MKLHPHWRRALLLVALVSALRACRKSAPIDGPTPNANKGKLTVLLPPVEHRVLELAEGQTLGKGDSVDILPGNMVVTGEGGHADLTWPEFMALDLATGTDLLVSVAQPSRSQASFDQAAGTVRYRLVGDDTAALFTVQAAAWAVIEVAKAPADIIVSLMPGPEPAVWVAVVKGSADLRRGAEKLRLKGGQVAAITEQGALPPLMEVDREALSDWYDDYAGGKDPGAQPADFLFRCAVRGEGAQLRPAPGGIPVDGAMTLDVGAVVQVAGRSADGAWVFVRAEEGEAGGWLEATDLNCNGPVANLAVDDGAPEVTATLPAATGFAPEGTLVASGYGAGTKHFPSMANVLRVMAFERPLTVDQEQGVVAAVQFDIDDMTGEEIGIAAERLRSLPGVLDLALVPAQGKKGRPVTMFHVLAAPEALQRCRDAVFAETSTIGLRWTLCDRVVLPRTVRDSGEGVRVKEVLRPDGRRTSKVESDDLQALEGLHERRSTKTRYEDPRGMSSRTTRRRGWRQPCSAILRLPSPSAAAWTA